MQINGFIWDDAVSETPNTARRHPLVTVLAVLVFAECALLGAASIYLVVETIVSTPASLASAIALTVLTVIATIWLAVVAVGLLRGQPWTRGAIVTWQVLQIAVAIGCFQGYFARPDLGWLLLVPSLVALGLLFTPPVLRHTVRHEAPSTPDY